MQPRLEETAPSYQQGAWPQDSVCGPHRERRGWDGEGGKSGSLMEKAKEREPEFLVEQESGIWLEVLVFGERSFWGPGRRRRRREEERVSEGSPRSTDMGRAGGRPGRRPPPPLHWSLRPRFAGRSRAGTGRRLPGKGGRERCPGLCLLHPTPPGLSHVGSEVGA